MASSTHVPRRVELWLKRGDRLRRPTSREFVDEVAFHDQRQPDVAYVIYERIGGTYSDGKGGRPTWQRA